jgi:hypothetical protein
MKAKRQIESGSNSVTMLDGSGGHLSSSRRKIQTRMECACARERFTTAMRASPRVEKIAAVPAPAIFAESTFDVAPIYCESTFNTI